MGSCPSSSPFRRAGDLLTGIDLPDYPLKELRARVIAEGARLEGDVRILTLACEHGAARPAAGTVTVPCVGMAPPSLIDFILSRGHADGACVVGCAAERCHNRFGIEWTEARFARTRDPYLRRRVPRERLVTVWAGPTETARLDRERTAFAERLAAISAEAPRVVRQAEPEPVMDEVAT